MRSASSVVLALCLAVPGCGGATPAERSSETLAERPPKTFGIFPGETVTYEIGVARPGDSIVCIVDGRRSGGAEVPKPGYGLYHLGLAAPGGTATDVSVTARADGSVVASCKAW
jgi:hypothetical protein